jgi:hypothetical protein
MISEYNNARRSNYLQSDFSSPSSLHFHLAPGYSRVLLLLSFFI